MACFLVSAAEAVVVTVAEKVVEKNEETKAETSDNAEAEVTKVPLSRKLKWLSYMLCGRRYC